MWPKALLELAPHLIRFVPAANRFLQDQAASDDANRQALEEVAAKLRGDLGQVTASHAGIYRQLNEMSEKLSAVAADAVAARAAAESAEGRVARMQRRIGTTNKLLAAALVMNFLLVLMVVVLLLRH